jgi:hypothetical protein
LARKFRDPGNPQIGAISEKVPENSFLYRFQSDVFSKYCELSSFAKFLYFILANG